jgi:hypothetical protein
MPTRTIVLLVVLLLLVGGLIYIGGLDPLRLLPQAVATRVIPPATLHLRNHSTSRAIFYVDGQEVCNIAGSFGTSGQECTIALVVTRPRELAVNTDAKSYRRVVSLQPKGEYQLVACGTLGTPDQDCGLFVISATPPRY